MYRRPNEGFQVFFEGLLYIEDLKTVFKSIEYLKKVFRSIKALKGPSGTEKSLGLSCLEDLKKVFMPVEELMKFSGI